MKQPLLQQAAKGKKVKSTCPSITKLLPLLTLFVGFAAARLVEPTPLKASPAVVDATPLTKQLSDLKSQITVMNKAIAANKTAIGNTTVKLDSAKRGIRNLENRTQGYSWNDGYPVIKGNNIKLASGNYETNFHSNRGVFTQREDGTHREDLVHSLR